jgi:ABC-2 type transport system ATP-binding protein
MSASDAFPFETKDLKKTYDGKTFALKGINLQMKAGEILGLLGPNGAGKTTLISILTTIEVPTSGKAFIFGEDVALSLQSAKSKIGIVPQELVSHGFFTIEEVLIFHSGYYGIKNNKEHIHYLLHRLGLWPHREKKVRELSGGMKRRFLIAKALVHKPKLLLLDEPTAGVDIELRNSLWEFVEELNKKEGMSILLTTHYLEEAEKLCDRVGIIHQGELKAIGQTKTLIKDLTQREVLIYVREPVTIQNHYLKKQAENLLTFQIPSSMGLGQLMSELNFDLGKITDVKIREGRLEDAFLSVLGNGSGDKNAART